MAEAEWFAVRLKELREAAGWTQQELATRAKLHRMGVAQLEMGRRKPAWETVLALCEALGVKCDVFAEEPGKRHAGGRPLRRQPAPAKVRGQAKK
jgi:transcriptional regulator with XRE-family HTH domain